MKKGPSGAVRTVFLCLLLFGALCGGYAGQAGGGKGEAVSGGRAGAGKGTELSDTSEYLPRGRGKLIRHRYYRVGFDVRHKQADWVYYRLQLRTDAAGVERSGRFAADPLLPAGSASPSDYTRSGYDRGHLCPAADMAQSVEAMRETFYMSNISPQLPAFNRGIWKRLETQVRKWAVGAPLYVATGPVFKNLKGCIGKNRVTVPGFFYKVIYSPARGRMIGFLLPHEASRRALSDYAVTVDSVETVTGLDFFSQLPDALENRLEAECRFWP